MKKIALVSIKTLIFFCRLGHMCISYTYTRYSECSNLEILGRTNTAFIHNCSDTHFFANRQKKNAITSDWKTCL